MAVSVSSLTVGQGDGSWRPGARASFGYRPAWFQVRVQLAAERPPEIVLRCVVLGAGHEISQCDCWHTRRGLQVSTRGMPGL